MRKRRRSHVSAKKPKKPPPIKKVPEPKRWDIINRFTGKWSRFLEIGVQEGQTGRRVRASEKWGVDPKPTKNAARHYSKLINLPSDQFFAGLAPEEQFDVIFIDGLHQAEQVHRDVVNSLRHLRSGGTILLHDCNPTTEPMQRAEQQPGQWTGDCWKAVVSLRAERADLQVHVIDTDFGIGVVRRGESELLELGKSWQELTWSDLQADRERLLGLVPPFQAKASDVWRVVIPSNNADRLRRSVASVLTNHPHTPPEWIIVVDDGARADWLPTDPPVSWVPGIKPFVYSRNVNLGIRAAGPYDIVVMGDDVEIQTLGAFHALQREGAITSAAINGPVGNFKQRPRKGAGCIEVQGDLAFVCVHLPRRVLEKVGRFDERFIDYGCEDKDYCWRAQEVGFKLFVNHGVIARHNAPGMKSAFRSKPDLKNNRERFTAKWHGRI